MAKTSSWHKKQSRVRIDWGGAGYHINLKRLTFRVGSTPSCLMLPRPKDSTFMAASTWKICLRNLFLDEWTSCIMSELSMSRFFSRKPVSKKQGTFNHFCLTPISSLLLSSWGNIPSLHQQHPFPFHVNWSSPLVQLKLSSDTALYNQSSPWWPWLAGFVREKSNSNWLVGICKNRGTVYQLTFRLVINNTSKMTDTKDGVMDTPWWNVDFASAMMRINFV